MGGRFQLAEGDRMGGWRVPLDNLVRATFVDRPNRFLVRCRVGGRIVAAFLPNPGRLWELLLPGAMLYVARTPGRAGKGEPNRRTDYTVLAAERDGVPVFLHTHWTNDVARWLIQRGWVPGLEGAEVLRHEVCVGPSRFDFLLRQGRDQLLLEVKSCTLFGNRVAMFPDAVTARGRRHLEQLAALARPGRRGAVLFIAHTPQVEWFMPDYHTDLAFSQTLLQVRRRLRIIAVAVSWDEQLSLCGRPKRLEIPWDYLGQEVQDRGSYLLVLHIRRKRRLTVGALGSRSFAPGYYVYVGSAMKNLSLRAARHRRQRKRFHWHVDYLRSAADRCTVLPVRTSRRCECPLAAALSELAEPGPAGFGSSDCSCPTHLFWLPQDPIRQPAFHAFLQRFRMQPPK